MAPVIQGEKEMNKIRKEKGFTLAELLVVVVIVGILIAISIPLFTAQTKKAVIAANKANIRAAKAAAAAEYYSNSKILDVHTGKTTAAYFVYDTKKGELSDVILVEGENYSGAKYEGKSCNQWGREYSNQAKDNKVCEKIMVFIGNSGKENEKHHNNPASVQTAPYYTEDNKVGYKGGIDNPFGPAHGSSTAN